MKRLISVFCITLCALLLLVGCDGGEGGSDKQRDGFNSAIFNEVSIEGIEVDIERDEDRMRAKIIAKIPDYTALFTAAAKSDNFESALKREIGRGDYDCIEYVGYAKMEEDEDGKIRVYSDSIVRGFMEKELIKAINAVTEGDK